MLAAALGDLKRDDHSDLGKQHKRLNAPFLTSLIVDASVMSQTVIIVSLL